MHHYIGCHWICPSRKPFRSELKKSCKTMQGPGQPKYNWAFHAVCVGSVVGEKVNIETIFLFKDKFDKSKDCVAVLCAHSLNRCWISLGNLTWNSELIMEELRTSLSLYFPKLEIYLFKLSNIFVQIVIYICSNLQIYLSKLSHIFAQIYKYICPNCQIYLLKFTNIFVQIATCI